MKSIKSLSITVLERWRCELRSLLWDIEEVLKEHYSDMNKLDALKVIENNQNQDAAHLDLFF